MQPYKIALTYETILLARSRAEAEAKVRCLVGGGIDNVPASVRVDPLPSPSELPEDWDVPLTRRDLQEEAGRVMEMMLPRALPKPGAAR